MDRWRWAAGLAALAIVGLAALFALGVWAPPERPAPATAPPPAAQLFPAEPDSIPWTQARDAIAEAIVPGLPGTVTAADTAEPIADATVKALDAEGEGFASAKTDADGVFRLTFEGTAASVRVEAPGYVRQEQAAPEAVEAPLAIQLERAALVTGTVRDAATGAPIEGVYVGADSSSESLLDVATSRGALYAHETSADGTFLFDRLPPGSYAIVAIGVHQGYLTASEHIKPINAEVGETQRVDFELERGGVVTGQVLDMNDAPLAATRIYLDPMGSDYFAMFASDAVFDPRWGNRENAPETDEQGRFEITALHWNHGYRAAAVREGYIKAYSEPFQVKKDEPTPALTIRMGPGGAAEGTARYTDGSPASEITIALTPESARGNSFEPDEFAFTDESGRFDFDSLLPRDYRLTAQFDFDVPAYLRSEHGPITIEHGKTLTGLEIVLELPDAVGGEIRGTVLDQAGAPVHGAEVSAREGGVDVGTAAASGRFRSGANAETTDASGRFTLEGVVAEPITLVAWSGEGYATEPGVRIGDDVAITLQAYGAIRGQVLAPNGQAAEYCALYLEPTDWTGKFRSPDEAIFNRMRRANSAESRTDERGYFEYPMVQEGEYLISAEKEGIGAATSKPLRVAAGQIVGNVRLRLGGPGRVTGRVRDASGRPVAGARATLQYSDVGVLGGVMYAAGKQRGSASSDSEGAFIIDGALPGEYRLLVRHADYAEKSLDGIVVQPAQNAAHVDVQLVQGGGLRGMYMEDGAPAAGAPVALLGDAGGPYSATTNAEGVFEFDGIAPGRYALTPSGSVGSLSNSRGAMPRIVLVDIRNGETVEMNLGPPPGAVAATGRVQPAPGASTVVHLAQPGSEGALDASDAFGLFEAQATLAAAAVADPNGAVTFDGVAPGRYTARVYHLPPQPNHEYFNAFTPLMREPAYTQEVVIDSAGATFNLAPP